MKRFLRIVIILVLGFTVLAAALVITALYLPQTELVRIHVEGYLKGATGNHVNLGHMEVSASFPNLVRIRVNGATVTDSQGTKLLSAEKIDLIPSLASLLKRDVSVESVSVKGLRIMISRELNGTIHRPFERSAHGSRPEARTTGPTAGRQELESLSHAGGRDNRFSNLGPSVFPRSRVGVCTSDDANRTDWSIWGPTLGRTMTQAGNGLNVALLGAAGPEPVAGQRKSPARWSVKRVNFTDAELDWTDNHVIPGTKVVVRITGIEGDIVQQSSGRDLAINLAGQLASGTAPPSPVKLTGVLTLTPDLATLEGASPKFRLESCDLGSFRPYLPSWMPSAEFGRLDVSADAQWKRDRACAVSWRVIPSGWGEPARTLEICGESTIATDWSGLQSGQLSGKAAGIPLSMLASFLPKGLPFDPNRGTLRADLQAELGNNMDWVAWGSVSLEKTAPAGVYKAFAKEISIEADLELKPVQLKLKKFQVSDTGRLLSLSGAVGNPFSPEPDLDLSVETRLQSHWIKAAGISLPAGMSVNGTAPVQGRLSGNIKHVGISLKGDLGPVTVVWNPYLEKPAGKAGDFHFKGKSVSAKGSSQRVFDGTFKAVLSGVRARATEKGKWLDPASLQLESEVKQGPGRLDLKDLSLAVKKESSGQKVLSVSGNIDDLGSSAPRIDLRITAALDHAFFEMVEPGAFPVRISGIVPLSGQIKGVSSEGKWSAEIPLDRAGLAVAGVFEKVPDIAGNLKAHGKWSHGVVELEKGRLTLSGLAVSAKGILVDGQGKLGALELTVPKTDTKFLAAYLPGVRPHKLSGPVEAAIRIKPADPRPELSGTIRLLSLGCKPENSGFVVSGLRGDVVIDRSSVHTKGLEGRLSGFLEGPLTIEGRATDVDAPETMSGNFSIKIGRGFMLGELRKGLADHAVEFLKEMKVLPGDLNLDQIYEFESLTGDLTVKGDVVSSENLRIVGPLARWGAIGKLPVMSRSLELLVGVHTRVAFDNPLNKVPGLKDMVEKQAEKHKDVLKMIGIDKDLKRLGIDVSGSEKGQKPSANGGGRPLTVILRVHGPASDPKVLPVLESSIEPQTRAKLNALIK
ncbi:MAG: DUF748 domain-containing protein [Thermodesulfobacteriota bacterium]